MKILCSNCGFIINRDKYIHGFIVEEYINIYGTHCPNCGFFIEPIIESNIKKDFDDKNNKLKQEVLERLRKKITGENLNVDREKN